MKNSINNTVKNGLILSTALLASVLAISSAFIQADAYARSAKADIASVTIVAKHMTEEQKLAFDMTQNVTQTVLISAKKLTAEQKLSMDREDQSARQQIAQREASRKHIQG